MRKRVKIFLMIVIPTILALTLIIFASEQAMRLLLPKRLEPDIYQSSNTGQYCATDGKHIYYIQKDGIYRANMDMQHPRIFLNVKAKWLSVDNGSLAYLRNDSSSIEVVSLESKTNVQSFPLAYCYYFYLNDDILYVHGTLNNITPGTDELIRDNLYICDISKSTSLQVVSKDFYTKESPLSDFLIYEDNSICWYHDQDDNVSVREHSLYAKNRHQLIGSFHWSGFKEICLRPTNTGTLILKKDSLYKNSLYTVHDGELNKRFDFSPGPFSESGPPSVFTGSLEFTSGKMAFIAQRYTFTVGNAGGPALKDHLYDILYLLDQNFNLVYILQTEAGERIIYADEDRVILLKDTRLNSVYLGENNRQENLGSINNYHGTLVTAVCGKNLLFFQNGFLINSIDLT